MTEVYETQRPRRRGRGLLITLVVLLLLLVGGLVAADRLGASYAERVLADRVAQEVANQGSSSGKPEVSIAGVPFLTQVLAGEYQEIRIELPEFTANTGKDQQVRMALLDIRAQDVQAPLDSLRNGTGDVVAGAVSGTGTVAYQDLVDLIALDGLELTEEDGKLIGSAPLSLAGQTFQLSGTAELAVTDNLIRVRFSDVSADNLPSILVNQFADRFSFDLRVPALPMNLAVRQVEVLPEGLRMTAAAENVTLSAGGL
ncbi:hypothetical protein Acsp01_84030 [Actinoplanes sp. NBRC 101535]|nr:hypothetical protein Acsp01_84030 [Actinoplanes sp. NBRC 101535]